MLGIDNIPYRQETLSTITPLSLAAPLRGSMGLLGGFPVASKEIGGRFVFLPVFFPLDFKRNKSLMLFNNIA
jgi:hypothetical protein